MQISQQYSNIGVYLPPNTEINAKHQWIFVWQRISTYYINIFNMKKKCTQINFDEKRKFIWMHNKMKNDKLIGHLKCKKSYSANSVYQHSQLRIEQRTKCPNKTSKIRF